MWCVSRFETIDLITKYKTICRILILVDLLKTIPPEVFSTFCNQDYSP